MNTPYSTIQEYKSKVQKYQCFECGQRQIQTFDQEGHQPLTGSSESRCPYHPSELLPCHFAINILLVPSIYHSKERKCKVTRSFSQNFTAVHLERLVLESTKGEELNEKSLLYHLLQNTLK